MMVFWLYPLILALVPVALAAAWFRSRQPVEAIYVPATHLFPQGTRRRIPWNVLARMLGSVLAVMAAAGPLVHYSGSTLAPAVLMVVLDNSASMDESDVSGTSQPTMKRWDVATHELMEVLQKRDNDPDWNVGLVLCAGHAELVCPPVKRLATLEPLIRRAGPQQQSGLTGTDLASGLVVALETAMAIDAPIRAIVLISDGENNASPPESGKSLQQLGQMARALGIPCHSLEVSGDTAATSTAPSVARQNLLHLGELTNGKTLQANSSIGAKTALDSIMGVIDDKRQQSPEPLQWPMSPAFAVLATLVLAVSCLGYPTRT